MGPRPPRIRENSEINDETTKSSKFKRKEKSQINIVKDLELNLDT